METKELTHKEVKMTRQTAINFAAFLQSFDAWEKVEPKLPPLRPKFTNALVQNAIILEDVINEYTKLQQKEKEHIQYEREKLALEKENAVKDENGKPVSREGKYWIENEREHAFDLHDLQEKHREAVDARRNYLDGEITLKLYTVERKYAPKTGFPLVTGNRVLAYFVVGEVEDEEPEEPEEVSVIAPVPKEAAADA
jgi:Skp family chaperone for outer membrane proteins